MSRDSRGDQNLSRRAQVFTAACTAGWLAGLVLSSVLVIVAALRREGGPSVRQLPLGAATIVAAMLIGFLAGVLAGGTSALAITIARATTRAAITSALVIAALSVAALWAFVGPDWPALPYVTAASAYLLLAQVLAVVTAE